MVEFSQDEAALAAFLSRHRISPVGKAVTVSKAFERNEYYQLYGDEREKTP